MILKDRAALRVEAGLLCFVLLSATSCLFHPTANSVKGFWDGQPTVLRLGQLSG